MKTLGLAVLLALTFHCNGLESFNRQQPERDLQKRADDNPPLENVVMQLSADLDRVQTQLTVLQAKMDIQGRHVAFLAQYPSIMGPASGPYKFQPVVFNDGNGYDPATGIFTVPFTGTYLLAAQFFVKAHQTARPIWDMFCNGHVITSLGMLAAVDSLAAGEESSSVPLIVKLSVGDRVWLEARNVAHDLWGDSNTFFAGALLYSE